MSFPSCVSDLHHDGGHQKLRRWHHSVGLLRLNPAGLTGCQYQCKLVIYPSPRLKHTRVSLWESRGPTSWWFTAYRRLLCLSFPFTLCKPCDCSHMCWKGRSLKTWQPSEAGLHLLKRLMIGRGIMIDSLLDSGVTLLKITIRVRNAPNASVISFLSHTHARTWCSVMSWPLTHVQWRVLTDVFCTWTLHPC